MNQPSSCWPFCRQSMSISSRSFSMKIDANKLTKEYPVNSQDRRLWWPDASSRATPTRKIHLDFHNSEHVAEIGQCFEPAVFAQTLKAAHVDSVVLFAKDMHGYFYYPSEMGPPHPALGGRDLLGKQIEACRQMGIQVLAYYCATWDHFIARTHPEWLSVKRDGSTYLPTEEETPGWTALCMSHEPFVELMLAHTTEILERYEVDGLWYDMPVTNADQECFCTNCLAHFDLQHEDPLDRAAQGRRTQELLIQWLKRSQEHARKHQPNLIVEQNQQTRLGLAERSSLLSNVDVEALPTGEWGYGYFPVMSRFVRALSLPFTGLTGRFHTSWADFGGLKSDTQLRVELAAIIAAGGAISVGDQLHPTGRLDPAVYRSISGEFQFVSEVDDYLTESVNVAEVLLVVAGDLCSDFARVETVFDPPARAGVLGLTKLLTESKIQFDIAEMGTVDFSRYELVIIADGTPLTADALQEVESFRSNGGKLIHCLSPDSLMDDAPWLRDLGVSDLAASPYAPAYMRLDSDSFLGYDDFDFALYQGASRVTVDRVAQATVLARLGEPAFQRSPERFTSHLHSPFDHLTDHPVALAGPLLAAIAFPLGASYWQTGYWAYSSLFTKILKLLLPSPLISSSAPPALELTATYQGPNDRRPPRLLIHAVNFAAGVRRGAHLEYFDEIVPVRDVTIEVAISQEVVAVRAVRAGVELAFKRKARHVEIRVPVVKIHEIIEFELASLFLP